MRVMSHFAAISLAFAASALLYGEESKNIFALLSLDEWQKAPSMTMENGIFSVTQRGAALRGKKPIQISPEKDYILSGKFRTKPGKNSSRVFLGYLSFETPEQPVYNIQKTPLPNSDTILMEDVQADDTILKIRDASWQKDWNIRVFYQSEPGRTDLPHFEMIPSTIRKLEQGNGTCIVSLVSPVGKLLKKDLKIRLHRVSHREDFPIIRNTTPEWQEYKCRISGKRLAPGTKFIRLYLLANWSGDVNSALELKELKIQEL